MKKLALIATTFIMSLSATLSAQAGHHNDLGGLIIGAGSGAIIGQAIGRNTESTVVGTAVGGVLGYIIGSEMDGSGRHYQQVSHRRPGPVIQRQKIIEHHYYYQPVEYHSPPAPRCKEAEILGTVNGRAKKIYGTVCRTPDGWELVSPDGNPALTNSHPRGKAYGHKNHWQAPGDRRNTPYWVGRRF